MDQGIPHQEGQAPAENDPPSKPAQEAQQGLSFSSQEIEQGMAEQFEGDDLNDLKTIIDAGNDILFGEETHHQILKGFSGEGEELAEQMAQGAVALTDIVISQSGGSVPGELIAPAATVLMARVAEFLNQSGQANVTDEVFEEAMHIYSTLLMDKYDPSFREKVQESMGVEQPGQMQQPMQQQQPQQPPMQQQRGLLNGGQ